MVTYDPAGTARVGNPSHRFDAVHMSRVARQAALGVGLAAVGSYEIVNHVDIVDLEHDSKYESVVVIRAYSPNNRRSVDLTAGDLYFYLTEYQDAPMARIM
jgi:hypothetical protein